MQSLRNLFAKWWILENTIDTVTVLRSLTTRNEKTGKLNKATSLLTRFLFAKKTYLRILIDFFSYETSWHSLKKNIWFLKKVLEKLNIFIHILKLLNHALRCVVKPDIHSLTGEEQLLIVINYDRSDRTSRNSCLVHC